MRKFCGRDHFLEHLHVAFSFFGFHFQTENAGLHPESGRRGNEENERQESKARISNALLALWGLFGGNFY